LGGRKRYLRRWISVKEASQMGGLVEVSKTGELQDGTMREVSVNGREILLARVGDRYYAAGNRCPEFIKYA
jgi:hypothetical protein